MKLPTALAFCAAATSSTVALAAVPASSRIHVHHVESFAPSTTLSPNVTAATAATATSATGARLPHIVYFLVDDLGYANVGFTAPEPKEPITPNIDELAATGLQLDNYYTYKFCSPTRSSFISGRLPIHVNQQNHPPSSPGGGVPLNMTTIADKLQSVGYSTHQVGKWHCGMSGRDRLPVARGFNSSFGCALRLSVQFDILGNELSLPARLFACLFVWTGRYLAGAEDHFTNIRDGFVDLWRDTLPAFADNDTDYGTYMYTREALRVLEPYGNASMQDTLPPLFLYLAYQSVHEPMQVPTNWTDLYPGIDFKPRQICQGMISAVDDSIGQVVSKLKEYGMFNNTLIIWSSDNGGPADHANNYPLRGAKGADFQGGVRVCAFLNGGVLPDPARGQVLSTGLMHIADWYATLGHLTGYNGTDDPIAAAAGLPAVDSLDMWDYLSSVDASGPSMPCPRTSIMLSGTEPTDGALIAQHPDPLSPNRITLFKLIRGNQTSSYFPGIHMPNQTVGSSELDCGAGQLYDLYRDPVEHHDLSTNPAFAALLKQMQGDADAGFATYYQSPGHMNPDPHAKQAAEQRCGDFWCPWLPNGTSVPSASP